MSQLGDCTYNNSLQAVKLLSLDHFQFDSTTVLSSAVVGMFFHIEMAI